MRVFVYEYASAQSESAHVPASIRAEGRAMLDAVVEDFRKIPWVAGVEVLRSPGRAPGLPGLRSTSAPATPDWSISAPATPTDWSLIIAPEFDGILESLCRTVEKAGGRLLGPSSAAMGLTADKWRTFLHWKDHGVPTPATWLGSSEISRPPPFIMKPRWGCGSQDVKLLTAATQMHSDDWILQEYTPGIAASVAFLIGPKFIHHLPPGYQLLSDDGLFQYRGGRLPLPEPLRSRAIALGTQAIQCIPGLRGYVGVDLVLGESLAADRAIEINPRLTTSYVGLRALTDANLAEAMLQVVEGKTPTISWRPGSVEFTPSGLVRNT